MRLNKESLDIHEATEDGSTNDCGSFTSLRQFNKVYNCTAGESDKQCDLKANTE